MNSRRAKLTLLLVAVLLSLDIGSVAIGGVIFPYPPTVPMRTKLNAEQDKATEKPVFVDLLCPVRLLRSTRADVERIFGKGKRHANGFTHIYENERLRVDVLYSAGPCKASGVERWSVPEDTVISMEIIQKQNILAQDFYLDPTKYARLQLSHPNNWVQYVNKDDGLIVHTIISGKAEELYFITREPSAKDKPLKCTSP
jgi:hypothetical protein